MTSRVASEGSRPSRMRWVTRCSSTWSGAWQSSSRKGTPWSCDLAGRVALGAFEEGGVQDHRIAGAQGQAGQLVESLVGGLAGAGLVDALSEALLFGGLGAEQALALHVGTHPDGAELLHQTQRHMAL